MITIHEARFYEKLSDRRVRCTLCPHDCVIAEGGRGACGVRYNDRGRLAGLKWSSHHLEGGSCDDEAQAAFGSVWSGAIALTRSPGGGRTR